MQNKMMYDRSIEPDASNISRDEPCWMKDGEVVARSA